MVYKGYIVLAFAALLFPTLGFLSLVSLLTCLIVGLTSFYKVRSSKLMTWVFITVIYFIGSGLISNGIRLSDLVSIAFYDGDGRIFINLAFTIVSFNILYAKQTHKFTSNCVRVSVVIIFIQYCLWLLAGNFGDWRFLGLHGHHTAFGSILGLSAIYLYNDKKFCFDDLVCIFLLLCVFETTSRQALISVAFASLLLIYLKGYRSKSKISLLLMAACFATVILSGNWDRLNQLIQPDIWRQVVEQFKSAGWAFEDDLKKFLVGEAWNFNVRVLLYSRAIDLFSLSPILGVGFGRFNDQNLIFENFVWFNNFAFGGTNFSNDKTAHNSILHILAETGIVGLLLVYKTYHELIRAVIKRSERENHAYIASLVVFILFGQLFGHAFASPSFFIFAVILLLSYTYDKQPNHKNAQANFHSRGD